MLNQLINVLLPYTCILCHHHSTRQQDLCTQCLNELPILPHPCPQCALSCPGSAGSRCGHCQQDPPPFQQAFALFAYEPPVVRLLLELKFHRRLLHARVFSEILYEQLTQRWYRDQHLPDLILPIPLHPTRLRERGFNQALEIAKPLSQRLGIELDYHSTQRVKATATQMSLPAAQRRANLQQAFSVTRDLSGLHIAVVDDVMTTGSTMREFCSTLAAHGAASIHVWCCARVGATLAG